MFKDIMDIKRSNEDMLIHLKGKLAILSVNFFEFGIISLNEYEVAKSVYEKDIAKLMEVVK